MRPKRSRTFQLVESARTRRRAVNAPHVVALVRAGAGSERGMQVQPPDVSAVASFFCGIEADNHASRRCVERAGFHLDTREPDHEDTLYYRRHRPITHNS